MSQASAPSAHGSWLEETRVDAAGWPGAAVPADVGDLQLRAFGALADRWPAAVASRRGAASDPRAVDELAAGLAALQAAVPGGPDPRRTRAAGLGPQAAGPGRARWLLTCAAELLDGIGDAARRVSAGSCAAGQEPAAEYADGVMTAALALRLLVELERNAIPTP